MEDNDKSGPAEMDALSFAEEPDGMSPPAEGDRIDGVPAGPADAAGLPALHDSLAKDLAAELSSGLRTSLTVRARGIQGCTYSQFRRSAGEPTCCFSLAGARGAILGCVEIHPQIAFAFLARLLGGGQSEEHIPDRPLTPIERRLLAKLADGIAAGLERCWIPELQRAPREGESAAIETIGPDAPVAVLKFAVQMHHQAGAMRVCVLGNLPPAAPDGRPDQARDHDAQDYHAEGPGPAGASPLELSVAVDECAIDAEELADLARGDIIVTDADANGEVIVRVAGIPKFAGRLGAAEGKRAVRITRRLAPPPIS